MSDFDNDEFIREARKTQNNVLVGVLVTLGVFGASVILCIVCGMVCLYRSARSRKMAMISFIASSSKASLFQDKRMLEPFFAVAAKLGTGKQVNLFPKLERI